MPRQFGSKDISWAAAASLAVVLVAFRVVEAPAGVMLHLGVTGVLAFAAAIASALARPRRSRGPIRLTLAFVLAAISCLPAPAAGIVVLASVLGAAGGGVTGPPTRGLSSVAVVALPAVALVELRARAAPGALSENPWFLPLLVVSFFGLYAASLGLAALARVIPLGGLSLPSFWRTALAESVNVPAAWILALLIDRSALVEATVLVVLLLGAAAALRRLLESDEALAAADGSLSDRLAEIDVLHAAARELEAASEPDDVRRIVERECRKIFPIDRVHLVLADEGGLSPDATTAPPIVERVLERNRGLVSGEEDRSTMAAPLRIEDRVLAVLAVESLERSALDEHALTVLTTLAAIAAPALERTSAREEARVDPDTGLLSEDSLVRSIAGEYERARRYAGSFAVLVGDIDGLREINRRAGRAAGTRFLHAVAAHLRSELRTADLAGRYGGDGFAIVLHATGRDDATAIAERIRVSTGALRVEEGGLVVRGTVTIGIAVFPRDDTGRVRDLLRRAEQALHRAKAEGPDRVRVFGA